MKNKNILLMTLFLVLICFSCQKEVQEEVSNFESDFAFTKFDFDVEVKNEMLSFRTRQDYDKALVFLGPLGSEGFTAWETDLAFKSMRSALTSNQREELGVYDDLLAVLISPDAKIEIAGNVFKLDAIKETVSMVFSSDYVESGLTGKNVTTFSTDDNILDILDGTDVRLNQTGRASYCDKRKLSWNYRYSNGTNKIHAKVVYQKAGFLNSLQSVIEEELDLGGTSSWNILLKTGSGNFWRNRKHYGVIAPYTSSIFNAARKSYRPYYSSRRLKSYRFAVNFEAQLKTGGTLHKKAITIDCN